MAAKVITQTLQLSVDNGMLKSSMQNSKQIDQTTARESRRTVLATTAGVVVAFDNLVAARHMQICNHDMTNWVEIGPESGGVIAPLIRLHPGETCQFPLAPGAVLRAKSDQASVELQVYALDT